MQRKQILSVVASLKVGGAEKVARDIGLFGNSDEFEFHYVVFGEEVGAYEEQILASGGKVFHIKPPRSSYLSYVLELHNLMKENRYHAVHAHTMFNCGWVMLAGKIAGVPIRISHAHSALDDGNSFVKQIYERAMRWLITKYSTDLVACGEKAGIRLFGERTFREKGNLILNGVDTSAFKYSEEKRSAIRRLLGWQNQFVIGHVGHLAKVKNQAFLLKLMPYILKKRPDARLIMLGEGEDRAMLEQLVRELTLEDKVLMPGNVTNVADYLCAMDVFAFPSLYEGMPLSVLEVQANGLPCVISTGVPKDVILTDLITPLPLTDNKERWIETILTASRKKSEHYAERLMHSNYDLSASMNRIWQIYRG